MLDIDVAITLGQRDFSYQLFTDASQTCLGIMGDSGCGKSTLFRIIAGLEQQAKGRVIVQQKVLQSDAIFLSPQQRNLGYVFQNARLFPHLNVEDNLRFSLKRSKVKTFTFEQVVNTMKLNGLLSRNTHYLSGGEQQRVAIARALLSSPSMLLLDEPLNGIDKKQKFELLHYLNEVKDTLHVPMLMISHNEDELLQLTDTVISLS
ncbi:ATP-binding cassette domain-containing protein [Pseudoalteromonas sp.]|uniref:ATP-binding cassette domain-containing protein n=1 Tax=Pseudoalteromonas sp. TaxID=53249 RepID=UPI003565B269